MTRLPLLLAAGRTLATVCLALSATVGRAQEVPPPEPPPMTETRPLLRVTSDGTGDQRNPAIASAPDGRFVIVWESETADRGSIDIFARRFAADGTPLGDQFRVNQFRENRQAFPAVAMNASGAFIIAWDSNGQDGPGLSVYARRYDSEGLPTTDEFRVNNGERDVFSRIGLTLDEAGNAAFVWPERRTPLPVATSFRIATINLRLFGPGTAPQTGQIEVATGAPTNLRLPTLARAASGDLIVAWQATATPQSDRREPRRSEGGIFVRRYTAAGVAREAAIRVRATTVGANAELPDRPNLAATPDGGFAVIWQETRPDFSSIGVFFRRYDAAAQPLGEAVVVGGLDDRLRAPAVGVTPDNTLYAVAAGNGLRSIPFSADGNQIGFLASADQPGSDADRVSVLLPQVAPVAGGQMRAVWTDYATPGGHGGDGSGRGIVSRVLTPPGGGLQWP